MLDSPDATRIRESSLAIGAPRTARGTGTPLATQLLVIPDGDASIVPDREPALRPHGVGTLAGPSAGAAEQAGARSGAISPSSRSTGLLAYVAMRVWSGAYFIPEMLAFQQIPPDSSADRRADGPRRELGILDMVPRTARRPRAHVCLAGVSSGSTPPDIGGRNVTVSAAPAGEGPLLPSQRGSRRHRRVSPWCRIGAASPVIPVCESRRPRAPGTSRTSGWRNECRTTRRPRA